MYKYEILRGSGEYNGKVGQEFEDFAAVVDNETRGKGRGRSVVNLLSLLGVYANAEKVLLTHAPSWKRAQCEDVVKAIAAKDADAAQSAAARPAPASQEEATRTKVLKCPGLRGEVKSKDGKRVIFCKVCKKDCSYLGLGQHCKKTHRSYIPLADGSENIDGRDDSCETDDVKAKNKELWLSFGWITEGSDSSSGSGSGSA